MDNSNTRLKSFFQESADKVLEWKLSLNEEEKHFLKEVSKGNFTISLEKRETLLSPENEAFFAALKANSVIKLDRMSLTALPASYRDIELKLLKKIPSFFNSHITEDIPYVLSSINRFLKKNNLGLLPSDIEDKEIQNHYVIPLTEHSKVVVSIESCENREGGYDKSLFIEDLILTGKTNDFEEMQIVMFVIKHLIV